MTVMHDHNVEAYDGLYGAGFLGLDRIILLHVKHAMSGLKRRSVSRSEHTACLIVHE